MRTTLSPAFTSSKMKYMFTLISQSGEQFVNYFLKKDENLITIEMKDTFTRFTNDVIANTAFGAECDSLRDRENEFYLMGKEATDVGGIWRMLKLIGYLVIPRVYKVSSLLCSQLLAQLLLLFSFLKYRYFHEASPTFSLI